MNIISLEGVYVLVSFLAGLLENNWSNFDETWGEGEPWAKVHDVISV